MKQRRIVLLGDSIIDNGVYVQSGEPDIARQLQDLLPRDLVTKRAVDGALCADVARAQIAGLEPDGCIILSIGGNDALQHIDLLDEVFETTSRTVLVRLWSIREQFRAEYASLLAQLAHGRRRVLVLTIYNPAFRHYGMEAEDQQAAETAVAIMNDVIQQEARRRAFDVLEIRTLFDCKADYANPIEPSAIGGAKLALAMKGWVEELPP